MSTARTPPSKMANLATTPLNHYASDPQLSATNRIADEAEQLTFITRRLKRKIDEDTDPGMSLLLNMFADFTRKQDAKMSSLNAAISTIVEQNTEIQKTVEFISNKYDDMLIRMQKVEEENNTYKKQIISLENKLDLLEKNMHTTSIEIRNVPKTDYENSDYLIGIVRDIGTAVGVQPPLAATEVKDIYRTKSSSIVVDLTTTLRKDLYIVKTKAFNKEMKFSKKPQLNTSHIDRPGPSHSIYLSEHLTSKTKHIFFLARGLAKNRKIAACWTSYNKVYVREVEGGPSLRIDAAELLHKYDK